MKVFKNNKDYLTELGRKIRRERLFANLTQEEMAKRAGMALSTYRVLEQKGHTSTVNLVKVLFALGKTGELDNFLSDEPIDLYAEEKKQPKRSENRLGRVRKNVKEN